MGISAGATEGIELSVDVVDELLAGFVELLAGFVELLAGFVELLAGFAELLAGFVELLSVCVEPVSGCVELLSFLDELSGTDSPMICPFASELLSDVTLLVEEDAGFDVDVGTEVTSCRSEDSAVSDELYIIGAGLFSDLSEQPQRSTALIAAARIALCNLFFTKITSCSVAFI